MNVQYSTGAERGSDAIKCIHMLSPIAMRRWANAYEDGLKYGKYNYLKGMPADDMFDHILTHISQFLLGDSSEDHLGHAMWNIGTLIHYSETQPELFDCLAPGVKDAMLEFLARYEDRGKSEGELASEGIDDTEAQRKESELLQEGAAPKILPGELYRWVDVDGRTFWKRVGTVAPSSLPSAIEASNAQYWKEQCTEERVTSAVRQAKIKELQVIEKGLVHCISERDAEITRLRTIIGVGINEPSDANKKAIIERRLKQGEAYGGPGRGGPHVTIEGIPVADVVVISDVEYKSICERLRQKDSEIENHKIIQKGMTERLDERNREINRLREIIANPHEPAHYAAWDKLQSEIQTRDIHIEGLRVELEEKNRRITNLRDNFASFQEAHRQEMRLVKDVKFDLSTLHERMKRADDWWASLSKYMRKILVSEWNAASWRGTDPTAAPPMPVDGMCIELPPESLLTFEDCMSYLMQSFAYSGCSNRERWQWATDFGPLLIELFEYLNWETAGQDEHLILNKIRQKLLTHWPLSVKTSSLSS